MNLTTTRHLGLATGLLALTALAACSSGSTDTPDPTPTVGISWTVDGSAVTTTTLQSQKFTSTISVAGTVPAAANPAYLSLEFPNAVGTYTFSPTSQASGSYTASGNAPAAYYAGANPGSGTVTGGGTIVVTALSATNVKGTFTFTGINASTGASKSLTNGTFNVGL